MIQRINEWLAVRVTLALGTMWCAYALAVLVLIPLGVPSAEPAVQYISSAFLQLVFLPLLMVGQNLLGRKAEERAEADHQAIMEVAREMRTLLAEVHEVLVLERKEAGLCR